MAYHVIWTDLARDHYHGIISYLIKNWSVSTAEKFIDELEGRLDAMKNFPYMGRASEIRPKIRKLVINRKTYVIYEVEEEEQSLYILGLYSSKQDSPLF